MPAMPMRVPASRGYAGARAMVEAMAEGLEIPPEDVLVASTGVIGEVFPTDDIVARHP